MSSIFGKQVRVALFGQSHAAAIGVTVDGLPAGEPVDEAELARFLQRRAPGRSELATARKEADRPRFLCGLVDGVTCGAPLTAIIENTDTRSKDYSLLREVPRPSHADYAAQVKFGGFQDVRGGGHFSGRLTAPLCIAGGICRQILQRRGIEIDAHIAAIGGAADVPFDPMGMAPEDIERLREAEFPVLSPEAGEAMRQAVLAAKAEGDSVGGVVECLVTGLPAGIGAPFFESLESQLAAMLFSIPAVKGVEFGAGFRCAEMRGSEHNDAFCVRDGRVETVTNRAGGILGGISSGMPVLFRCAFKPTPSIGKPQQSVRLATMTEETLAIPGRHDPCIVPRAVPVVEAAAAIVLLDALLAEKGAQGT